MKISFTLFVSILILFSLGLMMVFNTTSAEVIDRPDEVGSHAAMLKQLAFCLFGVFCGFIIYKIGYERLLQFSPLFYVFLILLLLLVFVPKIGMHINGAYRWLNCGGVSLQPSEFAKFLLPLYYLHVFFKKKEQWKLKDFYFAQVPFVLPIFLIIIEPDNGTAAILLATLVMLYFLTCVRWLYWALPIAIVVTILGSLAMHMPHVMSRIHVYLHPEDDLLGKGHQPYQAKIAAGSGGLWGRGLGESLQKLHYLPEARSDYIAAIFAEEMGFMGMLFLLILYMSIASLGFRVASKAKDKQGYYLATIFTFIISLQAFLNLGIVSGILPSKGTNLPFFSQGGSSLLTNIFMVAVIFNINRMAECQKRLQLQ